MTLVPVWPAIGESVPCPNEDSPPLSSSGGTFTLTTYLARMIIAGRLKTQNPLNPADDHDAAAFFRPNPAYIEVSYKETDSPKVTVRRNGVTVATSNVTSPSANDPAGTLILGGRTGVFASGEFADCIIFNNTVTATLRGDVERYMRLRYGL